MKSMQPMPGEDDQSRNDLRPHHKPRLSNLLRSIGFEVIHHRGEGDLLYYHDEQGREVGVLDLVGGYGPLLLGHSHPAIVAETQRFLLENRPIHAQGSVRKCVGQLARESSLRAKGHYCVVFGNSGTEAVEAAMKHAMTRYLIGRRVPGCDEPAATQAVHTDWKFIAYKVSCVLGTERREKLHVEAD
jgi:acetylornithine/succinyldiaminopimelate/putrescine aminotransferase